MSSTRTQELRHALAMARGAREHLREGQLAEALRLHCGAVASASFERGIEAISAIIERRSVDRALECTATLRRVLADQGLQIEAAIRAALAPRQPADVADLVDMVAQGIRVLETRDHFDLGEDLIRERAKNIVTGLLGQVDVYERRASV